MMGWKKKLEAMVRIALEGPYENFDNIIDKAIPLQNNESKYSHMLTLHIICLLQVTLIV